jgi:hypothetical protein
VSIIIVVIIIALFAFKKLLQIGFQNYTFQLCTADYWVNPIPENIKKKQYLYPSGYGLIINTLEH